MKFKLIFIVFIITFTISCFLINDRISNWLSSYQNNQYSNTKKLVVKSKEKNINLLYKSSSTSSKTGIIKIWKF